MKDEHVSRHGSAPAQSDIDPAALPSRRRLVRATVMAVAVAAFLAIGVVLPAEAGRDPLGVGGLLGLTEMGRIKVSLAEELVADSLLDASLAAGVAPASAIDATPGSEGVTAQEPAAAWRDSVTFTLTPNEGVEYKLAMNRGQHATYEWTTDSTVITFNLHADPTDKTAEEHTYRRGSSSRESGDVVAVFDGLHGWFWRNRALVPVSITLRTGGEYLELRAMK